MKKGFTIIEIIISITIILIIGTSAIFVAVKDKKTTEINFDDALKTYLSVNSNIMSNIKNNAEGVIVPLKVLYNDGLIDDNMIKSSKVNLEKDYYVLADAVQLSETSNVDCASAEGIYVKGSWDLENNEELIYICPRNNNASNDTYETLKMYDYFPKGKNPSNYVNVKYNGIERLWRILQINEGEIRLIANDSNDYIFIRNSDDEFYLVSTVFDTKEKLNSKFSSNFNKNLIISANYNYQQGKDSGHDGRDIRHYITYKSFVGAVDYITLLNANGNDGNWIYELYSNYINAKGNSLALGYVESFTERSFGCVYKANSYIEINRGVDSDCSGRTQYLAPVITLKSCAKLTKKDNCDGRAGSESCPYELNTENCA